MPTGQTAAEFKKAYIERIRRLRERRDLTQEQMADALGLLTDRYRKYESSNLMPVWLIDRFATIVGCDVEYVVTGKSASRRRGPKRESAGPHQEGSADQGRSYNDYLNATAETSRHRRPPKTDRDPASKIKRSPRRA